MASVKLVTLIPKRWKKLIEEAMEIEGWEKPAHYLRELIKKDLVEKGLLGRKNETVQETVEGIC